MKYVSTAICFEDVRAPVTTTATMMTTVWSSLTSLLQSEQDGCVFCRSRQVTMSMRMKVQAMIGEEASDSKKSPVFLTDAQIWNVRKLGCKIQLHAI